jgi:hypothetical protein
LSRFRSDYRRGFVLVNGFTDHLYTPFGTTSYYNAIADFHTTSHYTLSLISLSLALSWQRVLTK